jgi:hypothetical protein
MKMGWIIAGIFGGALLFTLACFFELGKVAVAFFTDLCGTFLKNE